jgi:hypothetical protein
MLGSLYIDDLKIGEVYFKIIDEPMGAIGGELTANSTYEIYRSRIQNLWKTKGIANISDFNFKIIINGIAIEPEGGIGVTEMPGLKEIYVEAAGLSEVVIKMLS